MLKVVIKYYYIGYRTPSNNEVLECTSQTRLHVTVCEYIIYHLYGKCISRPSTFKPLPIPVRIKSWVIQHAGIPFDIGDVCERKSLP